MVVFLSGLPSCLGASDAVVSKVCEVFRNRFPIVKVADALFIKRAVFQDNGDLHVMRSAAFIAKGKDTVLSC